MIRNKDKRNVIWSYVGTSFVMGVNIFLLPLILCYMPHKELGLWYVFASVASFIQLVNFGFTPCLTRSIGHVWGGAKEIKENGISVSDNYSEINYDLFNNVIAVTRSLYKRLGLIVFSLSISVGTIYIYTIIDNLDKKYVFASWLIYSIALAINMTFEYWNVILRGIGCVADGQKANIIAKIVQVIISVMGLLMGWNLIALSLAFLLSGISLRVVLMKKCIANFDLEKVNLNGKCNDNELRRKLLSNAKKYGLTVLSTQLIAQVFQLISASFFGLEVSAEYGLTVQLLGFVFTVASVRFNTFVPEMSICGTSNKIERIKKLLSLGICVFWVISIIGIVSLLAFGPWILEHFSSENTMLPVGTALIVSIVYFIENNRIVFTSYISTKNELPYTKPVVICSIATALLATLAATTIKSFVSIFFVRLLIEISYNGWKWMHYTLNQLDMSIGEIVKQSWQYYFKHE